jgi:hypothetical protein
MWGDSSCRNVHYWMMAGIMERKTARSDEALEGVEGNGDDIGNFVAQSMKTAQVVRSIRPHDVMLFELPGCIASE